MKSFSDLLKIEELKAYLKEYGFETPTEVQQKVIPLISENKSVCVLAQTGTGKTLSYALPVVERLKLTEKGLEQKKASPRAIILLPTKELTFQVQGVLKEISHHAKLRIRTMVGMDKSKRTSNMKDEFVDILVGGPGKIRQALAKGEISAKDCKYLILDEADQLLDMGFTRDINEIYSHFEWSDTLVGLISATRPANFDEFVEATFRKVDFYDVELSDAHSIKQSHETFNIHLAFNEKVAMTEMFLQKEAKGSGIIFLNRKEQAEALHGTLVKKLPKLNLSLIHGDMSLKEREDSIKEFRKTGGVLVATDIVARGLDIKKLCWVLNYDLPFEAVYYIHRAGRVGRAAAKGLVYNFITSKDFALIKRINESIKNQTALKLSVLKENKGPQKKPQKKTTAAPKAPVKKKTRKKKDLRFVNQKVKRVKKGPRYKRK